MLIKPVLTPGGKRLFSIRPGQILLAFLMLAIIGVLIALSFTSLQSQNQARETVLAEESDSSALVFVQRESFGLIIEIEEHLLGGSPIEDVLVARSTLAQRLNVMTSTGQSTYEVAGQGYRDALAKIDELILDADELSYGVSLRAATGGLLTQTRLLADTFQAVSRNSVQKAVARQATVDLWQGTLSLLALSLGALLFFWVVRDLRNGFRLGYAELVEQGEEIEQAERDFLALEALDRKIVEWNVRLNSDGKPEDILDEALNELWRLQKGHAVSETNSDDTGNDPNDAKIFTSDTHSLLESRLNELISQIHLQIAARERLEWERDHCQLTGLFNRRGMGKELVKHIRTEPYKPALLIDIDIDGFTGFNNAMGQAAGDELLIQLAKRLASLELGNAKVARIAADEFGLLIPLGDSDPDELIRTVEKAVRYESMDWPDAVSVACCLGWHVTEPDESPDEAAAKTGAALKAAKTVGKPGVTVRFSQSDQGNLLTDYLEQIKLRNALLAGEVIPYLQPIVSLGTRKVEGFEALARWHSPELGLLTPDRFLPLAIQGGLLDELFEVILSSIAGHWKEFSAKYPGTYVSVNVDPKTLRLTNFADLVTSELNRSEMDLGSLVLEITEQSLADSSRVEQLESLRQRGVRISLDDFGTGYSSLSQLSTLPIDILKVDRSFLSGGTNNSSGDMLRTIRQMADVANLRVVVEGIETEQVAKDLWGMGFESGQGYLFGKPANLFEGNNEIS